MNLKGTGYRITSDSFPFRSMSRITRVNEPLTSTESRDDNSIAFLDLNGGKSNRLRGMPR